MYKTYWPWYRFEAPYHSQCPKKQSLPEGSSPHHRPEAPLYLPIDKKSSAFGRMRKTKSRRGKRRRIKRKSLTTFYPTKSNKKLKIYPTEANTKLSSTDFTVLTGIGKSLEPTWKEFYNPFLNSITPFRSMLRSSQSLKPTWTEFRNPLCRILVLGLELSLYADGLLAEIFLQTFSSCFYVFQFWIGKQV